jgi:hypothetical protein
MTPRTKTQAAALTAAGERRANARELICVFAGLAVGTLIAGLVAWHQGTLGYFL